VRDWFEALQPREKILVATAGVVVILAVFWLAVWGPLDRGRANAAANVEVWRDAVAELRVLKGELEAGAAKQENLPALRNQSLVVIVDRTLRSRNLYGALQRSTPNQDNGIQLVFEDAAFDDLVLWLGDVSAQYALRVQSAGFNPSNEAAGRVNATVTLER
jgi:general secretion pathway protein M